MKARLDNFVTLNRLLFHVMRLVYRIVHIVEIATMSWYYIYIVRTTYPNMKLLF